MTITDDMCRKALAAYEPDRIQGFSTPKDAHRIVWGAPHWVLDTWLPRGQQELWRGDRYEEMIERCDIERMRLALAAALHEQLPTEAKP